MDKHKRQFDEQLDSLKQQLLRMATIAETMIDLSIRSLVDRDLSLLEKINAFEAELNSLQIAVDETAMALMATQQPVAIDLRFIFAATRINSECERIGDLAINIMDNVQTLVEQPELKPLIDIPRMAEIARKMVTDALDAFVKEDPMLAQGVLLTDDQVDNLRDQVMRELLTYMLADPRTIERAMALVFVARHIERIADHATNIAEDVIYMIQAKDVRHYKQRRLGENP